MPIILVDRCVLCSFLRDGEILGLSNSLTLVLLYVHI